MPAVKNVGEPCAGEPHARFDGGREETSDSRPRRTTPGASRLPDQPHRPRAERLVHARVDLAEPGVELRLEVQLVSEDAAGLEVGLRVALQALDRALGLRVGGLAEVPVDAEFAAEG